MSDYHLDNSDDNNYTWSNYAEGQPARNYYPTPLASGQGSPYPQTTHGSVYMGTSQEERREQGWDVEARAGRSVQPPPKSTGTPVLFVLTRPLPVSTETHVGKTTRQKNTPLLPPMNRPPRTSRITDSIPISTSTASSLPWDIVMTPGATMT